MLISVVQRNDGEINVIDHARVVKTFRDPLSSLNDSYLVIYRNARTDYRLALWLRLASPRPLADKAPQLVRGSGSIIKKEKLPDIP